MGKSSTPFRSRSAIVLLWAGPICVYWTLIALMPVQDPTFHSSQATSVLKALAQMSMPIIAVFLASYFPDQESGGRLRRMTREQFFFAVGSVGTYHVLIAIYFAAHVYFADYSAVETDGESFEGRFADFLQMAVTLSFIPAFPTKALFGRRAATTPD